jgi:hypothetical protein
LSFDCFKKPEAVSNTSAELIASIEPLRTSMSAKTKLPRGTAKSSSETEFGRGDSSVAKLTCDPEGVLSAAMSLESPSGSERMQRETAIHTEPKDPLIPKCRGSDPRIFGATTTILIDVAGNG